VLIFFYSFQRLLILYPMKFIAEWVVDDLEDGTAELTIQTQPDALESSSAASAKLIAKEEKVVGDLSIDQLEVGGETSKVTGEAPVEVAGSIPKQADSKTTKSVANPVGERWGVCAPGVDLSGKWKMSVSDEFKANYDRYLADLGQPLLVRTVAVGIIDRTTEELTQSEDGKSLLIRGRNIRGVWDRTLVASGAEAGIDDYAPLQVPVMTADSEKVEAESWWENEGTMHVSWLRGVNKYGGGAFESKRYLEDDGQVLYVLSTYHPDDASVKPSEIVWRFYRQSESA
jgi:hypothetical protein